MTSFIYKNCTVGEVTGMSDLSFGFNILNERGQPILSLAFRTRDDAAQARAEIAKAVAKAVEVTRPALTAAGAADVAMDDSPSGTNHPVLRAGLRGMLIERRAKRHPHCTALLPRALSRSNCILAAT